MFVEDLWPPMLAKLQTLNPYLSTVAQAALTDRQSHSSLIYSTHPIYKGQVLALETLVILVRYEAVAPKVFMS